GISNGLVALSWALIAQRGAFADVGMGIGMISSGLACGIVGEALFGVTTVARATLAGVLGGSVCRIVVTLALRVAFFVACDLKLNTALLVVVALIAPKMTQARKEKQRRMRKRAELSKEGGARHA